MEPINNNQKLIIGKIYVKEWINLNLEIVKELINKSFAANLVAKVERFYARYGHLKCTTSLFKLFLDENLWSEATTTTILWNGTTYEIRPYIREPRDCAKCFFFFLKTIVKLWILSNLIRIWSLVEVCCNISPVIRTDQILVRQFISWRDLLSGLENNYGVKELL